MKISQRTKQLLSLGIAFVATISMAYYYRREGQLGHGGEWLITAGALGLACMGSLFALQTMAPWARIFIFQSDADRGDAKNTGESGGLAPTLRRMTFALMILWSLSLLAELYHVLFYETGFDPVRLSVRLGLSVPVAPLLLLAARALGKKSTWSRKERD